MKRTPFVALLLSAVALPAWANTCTVSLWYTRTFQTAFPAESGARPFGFTIDSDWTVTAKRNGDGVVMSTQHIATSGTGWYNGLAAFCINPAGKVNPTFTPDAHLDAYKGIWYADLSITQTPAGGMLLGGYGCAASVQSFSTPRLTFNYYVACPGPSCPLVLDTRDEGFHLTSLADGVSFRTDPSLSPIAMSWTDPKYGNGWLVRPNHDGSWNDLSLAVNLFGNLSPQTPSDSPNGYRALKFFASESRCGDLDHLDSSNCPSVWTTVRVWIDNGDGIVQPGEIHTLDELGYTSISLKYHQTGYVDKYGNQFRYSSSVKDNQGKERDRSFDVFLVTAPR